MRIGIDLDGVVLDSETLFRIYEDIYDIDTLKQNNLVDRKEPKHQHRFNWTKEQENGFVEKYYMQVSRESSVMPGFLRIFDLLKKRGHEFILITARGRHMQSMKDDAIRILEENNIKFDKYHWGINDKLEICKEENVDLMIDDDWRIIKDISASNIKTLYFRDTNLMKLEESAFVHEVNSWGDIYRYIVEQNSI